MENTKLSVCGTDCGACPCLGSLCSGCTACEGKVFHAPQGTACPIYACVKQEKGLSDCGKCAHAPCAIWHSTRDPKYTDEEFQASIEQRMRALRA